MIKCTSMHLKLDRFVLHRKRAIKRDFSRINKTNRLFKKTNMCPCDTLKSFERSFCANTEFFLWQPCAFANRDNRLNRIRETLTFALSNLQGRVIQMDLMRTVCLCMRASVQIICLDRLGWFFFYSALQPVQTDRCRYLAVTVEKNHNSRKKSARKTVGDEFAYSPFCNWILRREKIITMYKTNRGKRYMNADGVFNRRKNLAKSHHSIPFENQLNAFFDCDSKKLLIVLNDCGFFTHENTIWQTKT